MATLNRRTFLRGAGAGAAAVALGANRGFANIALPGIGLEQVVPRSPINHVVVLMMENRSVDHYLGWRSAEAPDFDAVQHRIFRNEEGQQIATQPWGAAGRNEFSGCNYSDPGHGWDQGRVQMVDHDGDGEPDGWVRQGSRNDEFAVSYYGPEDVPVTAGLVRRFTTFDRYFCSIMASTYPNREYLHSGQGTQSNDFPFVDGNPDHLLGYQWPTIWDTLEERGVTWAMYFSNLPTTGLWGFRYAKNVRHVSDYWLAADLGTLPQVAFVDPWAVGPDGFANDDHPHADLRFGQQFTSDVVTSFIESPNWVNGALFVTYDEWGGFWDHVPPPMVADPRGAEGYGQLGFRVPTILVSPFAPPGGTDHGLYDHTSITKFIEWNWGLRRIQDLDPMARDAGDRNIGKAFGNFSSYNAEVDLEPLRYAAPPEAWTTSCMYRELGVDDLAVSDLYKMAERGWFDDGPIKVDYRFEDSFKGGLAK